MDGAGHTLEGDRELLRAFKRGDPSALALVFDLYAPVVAAGVRHGISFDAQGERMRIGHDLLEHEVEILVADVFSRAFAEQARNAYDGVRPFRRWLLAIARNLLVDAARERKRTVKSVAVDDLETLASDDADPETAVEERELFALVEEFAQQLGEPDKTIYRLRYQDHRSHRETGEALAMSEIQIRRRDARLRDQLLRFLRKHGFLRDHQPSFGTSLISRRRT